MQNQEWSAKEWTVGEREEKLTRMKMGSVQNPNKLIYVYSHLSSSQKAVGGEGYEVPAGILQRFIISPLAPSPLSKASSNRAFTSRDFWSAWVLTLSELCLP